MTALASFLAERGVSERAFARTLGVSSAAVSFWVVGKRFPSAESMVRIAHATGGAVTPNDLLAPSLAKIAGEAAFEEPRKIGRPPRDNKRPCESLRRWLFENRVSQKDFAARVGVTNAAVWNWVSLGNRPAAGTIARVTAETGGAVTASDWEG